ncbi:hypothetical protein pipiens_017399 [Culex pipiens pipiens]|uniref:Uncharacterized protein n=1 Tax=Culex pipiens pipiens TaxID=38569 RepID=A0ABD1CGS8_CULPP
MPLTLACNFLPSRTNTNVRYHFRSDTQKSVRDSSRRVRSCTSTTCAFATFDNARAGNFGAVNDSLVLAVVLAQKAVRRTAPSEKERVSAHKVKRVAQLTLEISAARVGTFRWPPPANKSSAGTPHLGLDKRIGLKDRIVARRRPTATNERSPLANCHKEASSGRIPQNSAKAHFKNPPPRQRLAPRIGVFVWGEFASADDRRNRRLSRSLSTRRIAAGRSWR